MALAPLYSVLAHPLLADPSSKFQKLSSDAERTGQNILAELLLGLVAPAYVGDDADRLSYAVALQVAYQLERGYTPEIVSTQQRGTQQGDATAYRDRFLHSGAAEIVARVTNTAHTTYSPAAFGV